MKPPRILLLSLILLPGPLCAQNPTMSDDFTRMMQWLTDQTAQGLGFNAGSTFDPPNQMKPWRMQPDISVGLGIMPYDKGMFPGMQVEALADKDPAGMLPDRVIFPLMTVHMRLGLPARMDLGLRVAYMTTPKNYRLSKDTVGNGRSKTLGLSLRRHFGAGGELPLLTLGLAYNHVFGDFQFTNRFENVELTDGFFAGSENIGRLEWDVRSVGVNAVLSRTWGRWTPFLGMGYNRMFGSVSGHLEANWQTPLIQPSVGDAVGRPEPDQSRLIFGFQRDGSFMRYFVNGELKTTGFQAGRSYIVNTGLAAPFNIGAKSTVSRMGLNARADLARLEREMDASGLDRPEKRSRRKYRYWEERPRARARTPDSRELIFLR